MYNKKLSNKPLLEEIDSIYNFTTEINIEELAKRITNLENIALKFRDHLVQNEFDHSLLCCN